MSRSWSFEAERCQVFGSRLQAPSAGARLYVVAITLDANAAITMRNNIWQMLRSNYGKHISGLRNPVVMLEDGRGYIDLVNDHPINICDVEGEPVYNVRLPPGSIIRARGTYELATTWRGIIPRCAEIQIISTPKVVRRSSFSRLGVVLGT